MKTYFSNVTGGVYRAYKQIKIKIYLYLTIHRNILIYDYLRFQLHIDEFQSIICITFSFEDLLLFS